MLALTALRSSPLISSSRTAAAEAASAKATSTTITVARVTFAGALINLATTVSASTPTRSAKFSRMLESSEALPDTAIAAVSCMDSDELGMGHGMGIGDAAVRPAITRATDRTDLHISHQEHELPPRDRRSCVRVLWRRKENNHGKKNLGSLGRDVERDRRCMLAGVV